jgi:TonB family protein
LPANPNVRSDRSDLSAAAVALQDHGNARRLIALTRDPALGRALQELASEVSIHIVQDLRKLTDELLAHGTNVALLDAAALDAPVDGVVDAITAQFPDLRLMIAGQTGEQSLLASRIASETVFRFIHKPATPQRLKLFLDAASREGERRHADATGSGTSGATPRGPSPRALIFAVLAAVSMAAAAAWVFWPEGAAARLNASDLAKVEQLVQQASVALAANRYVASDGSSAAELYRDALAIDEVNGEARTGFDNAIDSALGSAEQSVLAGKLDEARVTVEAIRLIAPQNQRLQFLDTQLAKETERAYADAEQRSALEARQQQIRAAIDRMGERARRGALLNPPGDNAITQFRAAEALNPGDPAVRSARDALVASLLNAADFEINAHRLPSAGQFVEAAGQINSSAPGLNAIRRRLAEAALPSAATNTAPPPQPAARPQPEPAAPAVVESTPPAPEQASAPTQVAEVAPAEASTPAPAAPATTSPASAAGFIPGEGVVAEGRLKALRRVPAEYPAQALERLISGWVELEFTIAKDGSVKDVEITAAEPRRVFDSASVAALRRYRYAPVLKDGQPVEQRARTRMRFTAKEQ